MKGLSLIKSVPRLEEMLDELPGRLKTHELEYKRENGRWMDRSCEISAYKMEIDIKAVEKRLKDLIALRDKMSVAREKQKLELEKMKLASGQTKDDLMI